MLWKSRDGGVGGPSPGEGGQDGHVDFQDQEFRGQQDDQDRESRGQNDLEEACSLAAVSLATVPGWEVYQEEAQAQEAQEVAQQRQALDHHEIQERQQDLREECPELHEDQDFQEPQQEHLELH